MKYILVTILVAIGILLVPTAVLATSQDEIDAAWQRFYAAQENSAALQNAQDEDTYDQARIVWLESVVESSRSLRTTLRSAELDGTITTEQAQPLIRSITDLSTDYSTLIELIRSEADQAQQQAHIDVITASEARVAAAIDDSNALYLESGDGYSSRLYLYAALMGFAVAITAGLLLWARAIPAQDSDRAVYRGLRMDMVKTSLLPLAGIAGTLAWYLFSDGSYVIFWGIIGFGYLALARLAYGYMQAAKRPSS